MVVCLVVAVAAVPACRGGDGADQAASAAATRGTTNVKQNSAAVCAQVSAPVNGVVSASVPDARAMDTGQLSRPEFGERLRLRYATAAAALRRLAPEAVDSALQAAIERWAAQMDAGAAAPDPVTFHLAQYQTLVDEFHQTCGRVSSTVAP